MKDHVCLGAVMGAYGVRGEARVKSFCADPSAIGDYGPLRDEEGRTYRLTVLRPLKGGYAVRLSGVGSKEEADALRGRRLWAPRSALPPAGDDEWYHSDLIGLAVLDTGGAEIGTVAAVLDHGAGDLLEVRGPGLKGGVLIPFTQAAVPTVDIAAGRLVVDPPRGTLPGDEDALEDGADGGAGEG
ncbi:ribosome maturation factor RimM [Jannaschia sp. W003]|uniref:ribosome maturation factor RimM n=1 Tax=Jannaschia sp. W003 TaxID=2867012 RepID=UPI0021A411E7|nr:ribosome maturation factor RimM [Jannaschia sp. W003]UWQ22218.1 ribosome maturation factor RimM [Jannaschia sp. W003]